MKNKKHKESEDMDEDDSEDFEEQEDSEELEDSDDSEEQETKPKKELKKTTKSKFQIGDIIPIQTITGYQVVKEFNEDNEPLVIPCERLIDAEILSHLYKE